MPEAPDGDVVVGRWGELGEVRDGEGALGEDSDPGLGTAALEFLRDGGGDVVAGSEVAGAHDLIGEG